MREHLAECSQAPILIDIPDQQHNRIQHLKAEEAVAGTVGRVQHLSFGPKVWGSSLHIARKHVKMALCATQGFTLSYGLTITI